MNRLLFLLITLIVSIYIPAECRADRGTGGDFFIATTGNDAWSGTLPEPNADRTDGPFATFTGARDALRTLNRTGLVTVRVRGGRYHVSEPVTFTPEDSRPVIYAAYGDEIPVIDGGKRITGWRTEDVNGVRAWVVDIPEVARGEWYFRQLFVNGQRRGRPRVPREGFHRLTRAPGSGMWGHTDTLYVDDGHVRQWRNLTDVELVLLHFWIEERLPVASYDASEGIVVTARETKMRPVEGDPRGHRARFSVENVFEELDEPGEWYLDRPTGRLYYVPMPGETPAGTEVYAPCTTQLLNIHGAPRNQRWVRNLVFRGIRFEHTTWSLPEGRYAASSQSASGTPAAVELAGARACWFFDCTVAHVGGYGFDIGEGSLYNNIVGCEVTDAGAGGVKIGGTGKDGNRMLQTWRNLVTECRLHGLGKVFHSGVGILSLHSYGNMISWNEVHDLYYTGISSGWGWNYDETVSRDNRIEYNHIYDVGQGMLSDMGGVYTLGVQPGTVVRGNVIHDVNAHGYGGWGIYPDEASSHIVYEDNIVYDTSHEAFRQHFGRENTVRNNIFAYGGTGVIGLIREERHLSFTLERNILLTDGMPVYNGRNITERTVAADLNVIWNTGGMLREGAMLRSARARGLDQHSITADPGFRDLDRRDFRLRSDSPVLSVGFRPERLPVTGEFWRTVYEWEVTGPHPKEFPVGTWQRVWGNRLGQLDCYRHFNVSGDTLCTARVRIHAPENMDVEFGLGCSARTEVYVNGHRAHVADGQYVVRPRQERFRAVLRAGENTVLVKVGTSGRNQRIRLSVNDPGRRLRLN